MHVYMAGQTLLGKAQKGRGPWVLGEIGQREGLWVFGFVTLGAGEMIVLSCQLVVAVVMIERIRITVRPGQDTDQWKGGPVVFRMARGAAKRLVLRQEGVVALSGVELAGNFGVAFQATCRQPLGGVTLVAGTDVSARNDLGVRSTQRIGERMVHKQVSCQSGGGDDAEDQWCLEMQQHQGRPPRIQRSPKRIDTTMCRISAIRSRMASQRCRNRQVWSKRFTEGDGSFPRIWWVCSETDRRR